MLNKLSLSLVDAKKLAQAAEEVAESMNLPVSIAVTDATTYVQVLVRMDGAPLMSTEGAIDKARSSAEGGHPTTFFERFLDDGHLSVLRLPATPCQGGVPVIVDGQCVGAVGVAGGPPPLDEKIAEEAISTFLGKAEVA